MQVLKIDPQNPQLEKIIKAAQILKQGGLVVFPTETVYGLGANFFDEKAIKRLHDIKQRPKNKPFTVHIVNIEDLSRFDCSVSLFGKELIEQFWPGPLTLIFDTKNSGKVGFRLPNNIIARELIRQSNTVIVAPSANISGQAPPTNAKDAISQLADKVDVVLDAGETALGKESTVIDLTVSPYRIMRAGVIANEKISETEFNFWKNKISPTINKILFVCTGNSCRSVMAEGYLKKRLRQIERDDIEVFSRGITTPGLSGATTETIAVLRDMGVDASGHNAIQLTDEDIKQADLILVMEEFHLNEILDKAPSKKDRVYLLAEFGLWGGKTQDAPLEIQDPIGKPLPIYKDTMNIIKSSIERLVKILI